MSSSWGKYAGVIDLRLQKTDGAWHVEDAKGSIEPIAGNVTSENETVVNTVKKRMKARSNISENLSVRQKPISTVSSPKSKMIRPFKS